MPMHLAKKDAKILQTHTRETSYHSIKLHIKHVFQRAYSYELEIKLSKKPWSQEIAYTPDLPRRKVVEDFRSCVGNDCFTTSESAPTLSACYATSAKAWTETIWDEVLHWLMGHSVSDTGRLGQKCWETDCTVSLLLLLLLLLLHL
jgi:hypothetical protein